MSQLLDELARSLARPMSRRAALRLMGGALVAATAGGLRPSRAAASAGCGTGGGSCPRDYTCCIDPTDPGSESCCPPGALCCGGACCSPGMICVRGKCEDKPRCRENETLCGTRCCNESTQYCADA